MDKVKNTRGGWVSILDGGGVNFCNQRGLPLPPPQLKQKNRLRHLLLLTAPFSLNTCLWMISPPQANIKLCTYGVLKAQNQVIGMILQITILKVLPKEGVPLVSFPLFNHFLRLSIRLGYNEVCTLRCLWTFATLECKFTTDNEPDC